MNARTQWHLVTYDGSRQLYRASLSAASGVVHFPHDISAHYRTKSNGEKVWEVDNSHVLIQSFEEGDVVCKQEVSVWGKAIFVIVFIFVLLLSGFSSKPNMELKPVIKPATQQKWVRKKMVFPVRYKPISKKQKIVSVEPMWRELYRVVSIRFVSGQLQESYEILHEMIGKHNPSQLPGEVLRLAAEVDYALCRKAFSEKRWSEAKMWCEEANTHAKNERATQLLRELSLQVKKLFLEAYMLEGFDPKGALLKYKKVLELATSADPYGQKAKEKIKRIQSVLDR